LAAFPRPLTSVSCYPYPPYQPNLSSYASMIGQTISHYRIVEKLGASRSRRRPCPPLAAYKNFFTLWKDADPDIPILKQAKAEYARLQ